MTSEPISKVSPNGSKTNLSFSLYYISGQYALNFYGRDYKFTNKMIAEKWYTVRLLVFVCGSILIFPYLKIGFKIKITQIKEAHNLCLVQAWLQNEQIVDDMLPRLNYDSNIGLWVGGDHTYLMDGQVRNFSFVKK